MIAAYTLVIGSLLAYGLWVNAQRRALQRESSVESRRAGSGGAAGS